MSNANIITGKAIGFYRLKVMISAAKLEQVGIKRRGVSAHATLKRELNIKGNRENVITQAQEIHDDLIASWQE